MSEIPADLYYTEEHEWVQRTGDDTVRVGITDYAQSALGDVVFVQLPASARKYLRSTVIWKLTRNRSTPTPTAKGGSSTSKWTPRRLRTDWPDCLAPKTTAKR